MCKCIINEINIHIFIIKLINLTSAPQITITAFKSICSLAWLTLTVVLKGTFDLIELLSYNLLYIF